MATEIVKLDVTVTDDRGEFISGLQQKNFRVLDRGIEQPIVFFAPTDAPAQILVMIETSPAVYLIENEHILAIRTLAAGLAPDDQVALVTYNDSPRMILPFTEDKSAVNAALGKIQYTLGSGDLNLFDSISSVLQSMSGIPGKKALLLLTTGLDSSSAQNREALLQKVRSTDTVIFSVALGGPLRAPPQRKKGKKATNGDEPAVFAEADKTLRSLATATGGRAFFPDSAQDFAPAYRQIAASLRHQYVLGIAPAHDGQFHPLTVQVLDDAGQPIVGNKKNKPPRIYTRAGYLAPAP